MADGLFYLGYFRGEMWKILKHKKSILHAVLLVIVLLSTARAISPLSSRPASWREALTDIMSISIAEGHRDVWTASVTHIHPSDSRFAAEFPIYNGIVGGVHAILGKAAWHGRMVSLLFAIMGLFVFYKIVIISFGDKTIGLLSTVLLALSNWLIIGSQIMPDVPAATMALLAVFFGLKYLKEGKFVWLVAAGLLTLLAGLTKLPSVILLLWVAPVLIQSKVTRSLLLIIVVSSFTIPCILYYFWWLPTLVADGAMALMYPTSISDGLSQVFRSHLSNTIDMFVYRGWGGYVVSLIGMAGIIAMTFGFSTKNFRSNTGILMLYGFSLLGLLVFAAKSGATLATHPYYAVPFLPLVSLSATLLILRFKSNVLIYVLVIFALGEISVRHFAKSRQSKSFVELSQKVKEKLPEGPYISAFQLNPQPSYYFERATWAWSIYNINNTALREAAKSEGAVGMIVPSSDTAKLHFVHRVFAANESVAIVTF